MTSLAWIGILGAVAALGLGCWRALVRPRTPQSGGDGGASAARELERTASVDRRAESTERARVAEVLERDREARATGGEGLGELLEDAERQRQRIESGEEPPR